MKSQQLLFAFMGIGWIMLPTQSAIAHPGHGILTQHLAQTALSPAVMLSGIGIAFLVGAGHALSPGHGKTMVAAYLIGSKGTSKDAVLLGLATTIAHTFGVFALGALALIASQYFLPEQLYPILSLISGLTVFGMGLWLLDRRLDHLKYHPDHDHGHHHHHNHEHYHHQSLSLASIISLGIAGGIIPCPSALVLLLSAIALHHAVYGMVLVSAFSCGLALVLVTIGFLVIHANQWLEGIPANSSWIKYLPIGSAIAVIITGTLLTAYAVI